MAKYSGGILHWWDNRKEETGRTDFGGVDYYDWLKENAPEDGTTGTKRWGDPDVTDLVWARNQFLNHIPNEELWETNQRGKAGGLYARVNHDIIQSWYTHKRGQEGVAERTRFSEADYLAAMATGRSSWDVRNWLGEHKQVDGAEKIFDALTENRKINIEQLYKDQFGDDHTIDGDKVQAHLDSGKGLWDLKGDIESEHQIAEATAATEAQTAAAGAVTPYQERLNWDNASKALIKMGSLSQFGTSDYHHFLRQVRDKNLTTNNYTTDELQALEELGITNDGNLENARVGLVEWMGDNMDKQQQNAEGNYPVKNMVEETATREMGEDGKWTYNIKTNFGNYATETDAGTLFSEADFLAARAAGHTRFQIYDWMKDNKSSWQNREGGTEAWNENRDHLIARASSSNASKLHKLQNPHLQEVADYIRDNEVEIVHDFNPDLDEEYGGTGDGHWSRNDHYWLEKDGALDVIEEFIEKGPLGNRWGSSPDWFDDDKHDYGLSSGEGFESNWQGIVGQASESSVATSYEPGEYWSQWGAVGPQATAGDEPELGSIQKMYAGAFIGDPQYMSDDEAQTRLDDLEEKFLDIMYEGDSDANTPPQYETAPDEWGLDIARMVRDDDGDITYNGHKYSALSHGHEHFDSDDELKSTSEAEEWFETLYKGQINWAFYEEDESYQAARVALGMDDTIDTAEEIRLANIWVHGQKADVVTGDVPGWKPYVAKFNPDTEPPWEKKGLSIGDYIPANKQKLSPSPAGPGNIEVNVAPVDIKRPENLPSDWSIIDE